MPVSTQKDIKVSVALATEQGSVNASYATTVQTLSFSKDQVPAKTNTAPGSKTLPVRANGSALHFVVVQASRYSKADAKLEVKTSGEAVELGAPLVLLGAPAIKLFGAKPDAFVFTNSGAEAVDITIAAGWVPE
jgi:hypothetical protein